jgi:hypothetical protein
MRHPTWTHGQVVDRILSGITRAELVRHGYAVSAAHRSTCSHRWPPTTSGPPPAPSWPATGSGRPDARGSG